jgi:hypothetical protein
VTEAVYDTATGRYLLIPQGSRLIGRYDSQVAFGQRRVLLVWTRLILPDTSSVALDRLPGIDPTGYAGLEDGVDWHWDRILAGAALSTLLGMGAELAAPESRADQDGNRTVIAIREGTQDSINQVGQEITKRNASIQPTLTIRPGFPMRVMVSKDLDSAAVPAEVFFNTQVVRNEQGITSRLSLGPLPNTTMVKLTVVLPSTLKDNLERYAALHAQTHGEAVNAETLIPHMLEAFVQRDRGFKRSSVRKSSVPL